MWGLSGKLRKKYGVEGDVREVLYSVSGGKGGLLALLLLLANGRLWSACCCWSCRRGELPCSHPPSLPSLLLLLLLPSSLPAVGRRVCGRHRRAAFPGRRRPRPCRSRHVWRCARRDRHRHVQRPHAGEAALQTLPRCCCLCLRRLRLRRRLNKPPFAHLPSSLCSGFPPLHPLNGWLQNSRIGGWYARMFVAVGDSSRIKD